MVVLLILVVGLLVALVVVASRPVLSIVGPSPRPGVEELLISRFVARSQRFRRSGAIVGLVLTMVVLVANDAATQHGVNLDLVMFASIGLAGSIGGSILAEAFRVRQHGPRTASLEVRDPDAYRDARADRRERVLLALAAAGVAGSAVTQQHLVRVVALAALVGGLALLRGWAVRRVALRRRPVLAAEVAAADDEVRRLATSAGISRPMVTLAALAVSAQWAAVVASGADLTLAVTLASIIAWVGSIVLFLTACGWWWTNRAFGLAPAHLSTGGVGSHLRWWVLGVSAACVAMAVLLVIARSMG